MDINLKKYIIICGHYGCGKTNFALNLALNLTASDKKITIVDLDIVNPYFRTSEYKDLLEKNNVKVISSSYMTSTLDIPALSPEIYSIFDNNTDDYIIIDSGGDSAGTAVLGRFSNQFIRSDNYTMLYLINKYRSLTQNADSVATILHEIEHTCRLKATAIVNNSHLKYDTSSDDILNSILFSDEVSEKLDIPVFFTTSPINIYDELTTKIENLYKINIYVKSPWE